MEGQQRLWWQVDRNVSPLNDLTRGQRRRGRGCVSISDINGLTPRTATAASGRRRGHVARVEGNAVAVES